MRLTELKKYKVVELRARLRELGLDTKGLKAELVERLWAAWEEGLQPQTHQERQAVSDDGDTFKPRNDRSSIPPTLIVSSTLRRDISSTSPPETLSQPPPAREFTDSATQTDLDAGVNIGVSAQRGDGDCVCRRRESQGVPPPAPCCDGGGAPGLQDQETPDHLLTPESPRPTQPPQREGQKSASGLGVETDPAGEEQTSTVEKEPCRGRAFYEFKEEIRYKRARSPLPLQEGEEVEEGAGDEVKLDQRFSDLHFEVSPDGFCGWPRFWARFPLLWSGCRLTHGVLRGSVGFEVRLDRKLLPAELEGPPGSESYGLRVGWSVADSSLLLGEEDLSYAYDGQGKKVSGGKKDDFGEPLVENDIIGCYVMFSSSGTVEMSFHRNGRSMGMAFCLSTSVLRGRALYPHVLCKSCSVRFHLFPCDPPWYPSPPAFTPLATLPAGDRLRAPPTPSSKRQCEVVMMVGLPGSGKSHWAKVYMEQHPEKHFKLLGTEALLACMISGGPRDSRLQQASQCQTELIKMAANTTGNYILDQTNVLFSARRFKLQLFRGFRRVVVVVFPATEEWNRRLVQRQTLDEDWIPVSALLKLQVSCSLPEQQIELLDELHYVELPQEQSQALLPVLREKARSLLPPISNYAKKKLHLRKNRVYPHGPGPVHTRYTTGRCGWNGLRGNMQLWEPQPRHWMSGCQDQGWYHRNRGLGYSCHPGY